ncbi:MAG: hypothetical protein HY301_20470 [Verrucomicrobia bacterium]|nr:hypothetical protein [Verrucomicrobiota bacterium]
MSLSANKTRITALTKQLVTQWEHTKDSWRDAKATEFEKKYLEELLASVDSAVTVMEQLDKVLMKVRTDCE